MNDKIHSQKKNIIIASVMVILFFNFTVFLFAPLELYFTNIDSFVFNIYDFLPYSLVMFTISSVVMTGVYLVLYRFLHRVAVFLFAIGTAIAFAFYIQGNFLLTNYGQLDGQPIDWSKYRIPGVISVCLWILFLGVCLFAVKKWGIEKFTKAAGTVAVCVILVQTITLVMVAITKNGFSSKEKYVVTDENEFCYSKNQNFTIVLMDAFDSRVFTDLLNSTEGQKYREILKDFTYYQNTMTTFNLTDFSIPQIVTGEKYLNETTYGEYLDQAYLNSSFLTQLQEQQYDLNLYTPITIPQGESTQLFSNWKYMKTSVSSHKRMLVYLYKLVGFRYLPQPLKQTCWFYSDDMNDLQVAASLKDKNGSDVANYDWSNKMFYDSIPFVTTDSEQNSYHFYHLKGLHVIRLLDENMNEIEEQTTLDVTAKAMMKMMDTYLSKLKEEGVYDNNVIIFMADHAANEYEEKQYKQCPLLLIKGINASHDFDISTAPVSYEDLQEAYKRLLKGADGAELFDAKEGEKRTRYLYQADWTGGALQEDSYSTDFVEFSSDQNAFDSAAIQPTGKVFEKK